MKTTTQTRIVIVSAVFASLFALAHAFSAKPEASVAHMQTITIAAQRMSAAQKLAYDNEQQLAQTVVISAKRMSDAQKASFDAQQLDMHEYVAANSAREDAI